MNPLMLLCCGSNYFGQLGLGEAEVEETKDEIAPNTWFAPNQLSPHGPLVVSCGAQCTVVVDAKGKMFFSGQLNGQTFPRLSPVDLPYPLAVVQVACGRKHMLARMEGGHIFSWGTGYFGQLGHGDDNSWDTPRLVRGLEPQRLGSSVCSVFCGGNHSGALTDAGQVFMWGLNRNGQTGTGVREESIMEPHPIDTTALSSRRAVSVVCGRNHSVLLTQEGRVFIWGAVGYFRLGLNTRRKQEIPCEVDFFRQAGVVTSIHAGDFHTVAVVRDNQERLSSTYPPRASYSSVLVGDGGVGGSHVYVWGYGMEGQVGNSGTVNTKIPHRIPFFDNIDIAQVECGSTWTMARSTGGHLYVWGYLEGEWGGLLPPRYMPNIDSEIAAKDSVVSHAYSFDSCHNALRPVIVPLCENYFVHDISCGGGHSVFSITARESKSPGFRADNDKEEEKSSSRSETKYDTPISSSMMFNWCRTNQLNQLCAAISEHGSSLNLNIVDEHYNSLLIVACSLGFDEICRVLVESGADVNYKNRDGNSALHFCMSKNFNCIGEFLISAGANEFAQNLLGLTCYEGMTLDELNSL